MKSGIKHLNEWLIVLLTMAGIAFIDYLFLGSGSTMSTKSLLTYLNPTPGNLLVGLETVAAIDQFSGRAIKDVEMSLLNISILISTVVVFITGPWLLFTGYKKDEEQEDTQIKPWYWFLGASLSLWSLLIIPALLTSVYQYSQRQDMVTANRLNDEMRNELMDVGFEAAEYAILNGGFQDSFQTEDLNRIGMKFEYAVEEGSSDSLIIIVSKGLETSAASFKNLKYKLEVKPFQDEVLLLRN